MKFRWFLCVLVSLLIAARDSEGHYCTWIGGPSGRWDQPANWDCAGGYPQTVDDDAEISALTSAPIVIQNGDPEVAIRALIFPTAAAGGRPITLQGSLITIAESYVNGVYSGGGSIELDGNNNVTLAGSYAAGGTVNVPISGDFGVLIITGSFADAQLSPPPHDWYLKECKPFS